MKTNGNDCANPISADVLEKHRQGHFKSAGEPNPFGLTKREHFAAMALQAVMTGNNYSLYNENELNEIAKWSVLSADALIKALNEGGQDA